MMYFKYYYPKLPQLKNIVKCYWMMEITVDSPKKSTMVPVRNMDIVLDYSGEIQYQDRNHEIKTDRFIFCGLRRKPFQQTFSGTHRLLGIMFYPGVIYSLFNVPLSQFKNNIVKVDDVISGFSQHFIDRFPDYEQLPHQWDNVDQFILKRILNNRVPRMDQLKILNDFYNAEEEINLEEYCNNHGVGQRTLERLFHQLIGETPKGFLKLNRFRKCFRQLISQDYKDLTSISQDNGYYDQSHFIYDFKSYTGLNPGEFIENQDHFLKEISFHRIKNCLK